LLDEIRDSGLAVLSSFWVSGLQAMGIVPCRGEEHDGAYALYAMIFIRVLAKWMNLSTQS
jgi:hypothetical protein